MRVAPLRVWKCLKAPESVIKWNRLYCTCILLALLRIHRSIFERVWCLPKIKTTKWSMRISIEQYWSRIGSHGNFVKTKDILSRLKDQFWSVMLLVFHWFKCILLAHTETICWTIQKCGMMWRFGFPKMIFYKQQEQYVLTTVKEIKYFLWKCW